MERMREISIACIALMFLLTAVTIPYTLANTALPAELTAGGGAGSGDPKSATDVGNVCVCSWDDTLRVKYDTTGTGWCLTETHLHVATSLEGIPQTKKGNPIPGKFTYKDEYDPCVTEYTNDIGLGGYTGTVYIAFHAVVCKEICGKCVCETAWAGIDTDCDNLATDYDFPGKNWATYLIYPEPPDD